jgi:MFS family permease
VKAISGDSDNISEATQINEIRRGWPLILGCAIGIGIGIMALPYSTAGLFISALEQEFGWTRTEISLGPTILLAIVALVSPAVGWLADRISPLVIITVSMTAVAGAFGLLSQMGPVVTEYFMICAGMALLGAGASTVVFARIVCANFFQRRGLALGLVMAGNGVTAMLSPIVIGPIISHYGWRIGYLAIAILILIGTPFIILLLRSRAGTEQSQPTVQMQEGVCFSSALAMWHFWVMSGAFLLGTLATTGMVVHLVPFLTDSGVTMARAAATASAVGAGLIGGRLLTGWLMDRFVANRVGAVMMAVSALGLLLLALGDKALAPLGAVAIGLCIGAELDVIGYLTGRYFGMVAFGRIYGALYMFCAAGTALSPIFYGLSIDLTGTYTAGLLVGATMLFISSIMLYILPRFQNA